MAELRTTLYSKELQKQIFPDSSFYKRSIAETGVADSVISVEKPVQGKGNKAKEGEPESYPLKVSIAKDTKKTYDTTLLYCEPILIDSQSEMLTNYSKRQTKQQQQAAELELKAANYCAYHWSPTKADNILKTSGTGRASNIQGFSSNRKAVTKDDFVNLHNLMMRMNVASMGGSWFGMITPDMYSDILKMPDFVDYYKTGMQSKLETGVVGRILGIEIMVRSTDECHAGILYDAAGNPLRAESEMKDELLAGGLFWNEKMVCRAEGTLRSVINTDAPGYLGGTIIESFVRFGADIIRDDQRGVITLLEAKA